MKKNSIKGVKMQIETLTADKGIQAIVLYLAGAINGRIPDYELRLIRNNPCYSKLRKLYGDMYLMQLKGFSNRFIMCGTMGISVVAINFADDLKANPEKYVLYMIEDLIKRALKRD